jgi:hypothetical protein
MPLPPVSLQSGSGTRGVKAPDSAPSGDNAMLIIGSPALTPTRVRCPHQRWSRAAATGWSSLTAIISTPLMNDKQPSFAERTRQMRETASSVLHHAKALAEIADLLHSEADRMAAAEKRFADKRTARSGEVKI